MAKDDNADYEPSNLGRYKVNDVGRANPHLRAAIGNTPLQAIEAEEGDYIVVEEIESGLLITLTD